MLAVCWYLRFGLSYRGWLPRIAAALAWVVVGYRAVVACSATPSSSPPGPVRLPVHPYPEAPLEAVTAAPLLIIGVIVVLLLVGGFTGFRRRDLGY